jgi:hypothetical protein
LSLHCCDFAVSTVLDEEVLEVLLQELLYHLLQPGVLLRYSEDLLEALLDLALDLTDLLVHFVEVGIIGNLLRI